MDLAKQKCYNTLSNELYCAHSAVNVYEIKMICQVLFSTFALWYGFVGIVLFYILSVTFTVPYFFTQSSVSTGLHCSHIFPGCLSNHLTLSCLHHNLKLFSFCVPNSILQSHKLLSLVRYFWIKYDLDRGTTHLKFDLTGVQTYDLLIMTVHFMSPRCGKTCC